MFQRPPIFTRTYTLLPYTTLFRAHGADAAVIEAHLRDDRGHAIKAVCVVHNETSTGVTSRVAEVRAAIDRAGHPALLMVDTISSLGSIDYRHDERSEEHTSELQSLMRISYAVFCLKKKKNTN